MKTKIIIKFMLLIFLLLKTTYIIANEKEIYGLDKKPNFHFQDASAYLIKNVDLKTCTSNKCKSLMTLKAGCQVEYYDPVNGNGYGEWIRIKSYVCNDDYFKSIYTNGYILLHDTEKPFSLDVYDDGLQENKYIKDINKNINSNHFLLKSCDDAVCTIIADTRKDDIEKLFTQKNCFIEVKYTNYWENHGGWHNIPMSDCQLRSTNQLLVGAVKFLK